MTLTMGIEGWVDHLVDNSSFYFGYKIDGVSKSISLTANYGQGDIQFGFFEVPIGVGEELKDIELLWERGAGGSPQIIAADSAVSKVFATGGKLKINSLNFKFGSIT